METEKQTPIVTYRNFRVLVKAWFDHRPFEATVIRESSGEFGHRMFLVAPDKGAAVWRDPSDCKLMLDFTKGT
jgi:hypothetical protein